MYKVKKYINSQPVISFSLPYPDWYLLEESELYLRSRKTVIWRPDVWQPWV